MEEFVFKGDWLTPHPFPILSKLAYKTFSGNDYWIDLKEKLEAGFVYINIEEDGKKSNQKPLPEQVSAISYIVNNEEKLLVKIAEILRIQYPLWQDDFGGDPVSDAIYFPKLNSTSDLKKALTIIGIHIYKESKEGISYSQLDFLCPWEEEHGFSVIFHRDTFIEHGWNDLSLDVDSIS